GLGGGAALFPAELGLAPHPGTCRHGEGTGLEVAVEHAALQQLDPGGRVDVALQLAGDGHGVGPDAAGDLGTHLDGEVALHVDVALEAARDADMAGTLDLALDGEVGCDQRFLGGHTWATGGFICGGTGNVAGRGGLGCCRAAVLLILPDSHRGCSCGESLAGARRGNCAARWGRTRTPGVRATPKYRLG